jgi:hypothetical protein
MREQHREKIELPDELFRYRSGVEEVAQESKKATPLEKIEFDGGIKIYLQGANFPQKGMASPDIMWSVNIAKRIFVEGIRLVTRWYFIPGLMVSVVSKKARNDLARTFSEISYKAIRPYVLKTNYMKPVAKELEWFVYKFLENIDIENRWCLNIAEVIASAFDYDNAYQFRLEDLMSETNKLSLINNPRGELKYMLSQLREREPNKNMAYKLSIIGVLLRWLLLLPKYKKAFVNAVKEVDIRKMQYDDADKYWVMLRKDGHKYMGLTDDERENRLLELGYQKPELIDIK